MSALKDIMSPNSIAIVGASDNKGRIGGKPLSYMLDHKYSGKIFPVNPKPVSYTHLTLPTNREV